MPIVAIFFAKRYMPKILKNAKSFTFNTLSLKYKIIFFAICLTMFLFGELFLRLFFEILIGYFDMHNALMKLKL